MSSPRYDDLESLSHTAGVTLLHRSQNILCHDDPLE